MLLKATEVLCVKLGMQRREGQVLLDYRRGCIYVGDTPVLHTNAEGELEWIVVQEWPMVAVSHHAAVLGDPRVQGIQ